MFLHAGHMSHEKQKSKIRHPQRYQHQEQTKLGPIKEIWHNHQTLKAMQSIGKYKEKSHSFYRSKILNPISQNFI